MLEVDQIMDVLLTAGAFALVALPILVVALASLLHHAMRQGDRLDAVTLERNALRRRLADVEALRRHEGRTKAYGRAGVSEDSGFDRYEVSDPGIAIKAPTLTRTDEAAEEDGFITVRPATEEVDDLIRTHLGRPPFDGADLEGRN